MNAIPQFFEQPADEPETQDEIVRRTISEIMKGRQPAPKPDLSEYIDATVSDPEHGILFLAHLGEKIIVEHPDPWIPTYVGSVERVWHVSDDENNVHAGNVLLWDQQRGQHAMTNYVTALSAGVVLKLAEGSNRVEAGKRKRGRPKGSKNRPRKK